jgi:hypothetical protein
MSLKDGIPSDFYLNFQKIQEILNHNVQFYYHHRVAHKKLPDFRFSHVSIPDRCAFFGFRILQEKFAGRAE